MSTSKVTYLGNLRTECEHLKSGNTYITDAPTDNNGVSYFRQTCADKKFVKNLGN